MGYHITSQSLNVPKGSHGINVTVPSTSFIFSIGVQNIGMRTDVAINQNFVQAQSKGFVAVNNQSGKTVELVIWTVLFDALTPKLADDEVGLTISPLVES